MPEPKKSKIVRRTKPHQVTVRLTTETYHKLREQAAKEDRDVGYVIRRALHAELGLDSKAA